MNTYAITYYYGQQMHRAYAGSAEAARAYAAELIQHNRILPEDAMSIVRVADGRMIYYKAHHITLSSLYMQTSVVNRFFDRAKSLVGRIRTQATLPSRQAGA